MFEVSTRVEFKGWKEFEGRDTAKVELVYLRFMEGVQDQARELWFKYTPVGWEDKPTTYNMQEHIEIGEVERHSWGYAVEAGITPVVEAELDDADPMYPRYVDEGTGIYNLKKRSGKTFIARGTRAGNFASVASGFITPKTKKYMVFQVPIRNSSGGFAGETQVFARKTRGQKGQRFVDEIQKELNAWIRVNKKKYKFFLKQAVKDGKI